MNKIYFTALLLIVVTTSQFAQGVSHTNSYDLENPKEVQLLASEEDHCEVPCGIYGDSLRVSMIKEHVSTIQKAMEQINTISKETTPNYNQLVRWVTSKEKHAEEIQGIVSQYFLHQRVKMPAADLGKKELKKANEKYFGLLASLHSISVHAMKCKQSTDTAQTTKLTKAIEAFEGWYFHGHKH